MTLEPGQRVDRYVVEALLGAGGMAEVYAVRHVVLGAPAALKVLRTRSPQLVGRMMREGRAQSRLRHPNVVAVLDLLDLDGAPALVMERVEGPTLAEVLAAGPLPLERVDAVARGLLSGLHAAHQLGIVHRDLKPANVLLAPGDVPRIVDFGLATALAGEADPALTRPGTPIGTPAYMSPEQHEDAHDVDARADLFALGVVLYEMLCGAAPAAGANLVVAWSKMTQRRWRPLDEIVPELPARIAAAVGWALEPDREQRVPDAPRMWEALFDEPFPEGPSPVAAPTPAPPRASHGVRPAPLSPNSAIPRPARSLIGRRTELASALDRLEARGALVTLVGTAGVGKTRVALEIAARWRAARRPALWIDLHAARDEQDLARAVASRLSETDEASADGIARALGRHGPLLLVLDNLEQLPPAAGEAVASWVRAAPSLRVLGTSRQPLGVVEEEVHEVHPLPVPDDPAEVADSEAWALLQAAAPPGALDEVAPERVHRLMRALDGLPLALELAAARLEVLTIEQLAERMADRFAVLASPRGTDPRGHRGALYDAIAWSWSLLSEAERSALAQLSVFVASFGLDAAEAVVVLDGAGAPAAGPGSGSERSAVLDALHALVRRSLVRRTGARFSLLGSIREFAALRLEGAERRAALIRHAAWFSAVPAPEPDELLADWGAVVERAREVPELAEAALICALGRCAAFERSGPMSGVAKAAEAGLGVADPGTEAARDHRHALRLHRVFALRRTGRTDEANDELTALLAEPVRESTRARALAHLADLRSDAGLAAEATALYREAYELALAHGPPSVIATTAASLGSMTWRTDPEGAAAYLDRALAATPPDDLATLLQVRKERAWVSLSRDALDDAEGELEAVLDLADRLGHRRSRLYAVGQLGLVREHQGRVDQAIALYREAEDGMAEVGDEVFAAYYRGYRARAAARLRRWDEAAAGLRGAVDVPGLAPEIASRLRLTLAVVEALGRRGEAAEGCAAAAERDDPELRALPGRIARALAAADAGDSEPAREVLAGIAAVDGEVRRDLLLDLAAADLEEECAAWRISADGAAVRSPEGAWIDLARYAANARILAHLARVRAESPGRTTDAEGLAAAGWPGERIVPSAAANRVRVALSALRRAGLAGLIDRADGGWRLDPTQPLRYPSGVAPSGPTPRRA